MDRNTAGKALRGSDGTGLYFFIGILFTVLGTIFLIVGIIVSTRYFVTLDDYEEVEATVTYVDYGTFVTYEYDGKTYENVEIGYRSTTIRPGDSMKIRVNRETPEKITTSADIWAGGLFILISLIFLVIGILMLRKGSRESKQKKKILTDGIIVRAVVNSITRGPFGVNRRDYFYVTCTYRDPYSGIDQSFLSEHIYLNEDYMENWHVGDYVNVYVLPGDYSQYYVDTSSRQSSLSL